MKFSEKFSDKKGAAAVEFAIILPFLVLLIFGTIEFSLLLFNKQVITNAAREAARAVIIVPRYSDADMATRANEVVTAYASDHLITFSESPTPPTVSVTRSGTDPIEDYVKVEIVYDYDFLVLSNLGFDPITIGATSQMNNE